MIYPKVYKVDQIIQKYIIIHIQEVVLLQFLQQFLIILVEVIGLLKLLTVTSNIPTISSINVTPRSDYTNTSRTFTASLSGSLPSGYSTKIDIGDGYKSMYCRSSNCTYTHSPATVGQNREYKVKIVNSSGSLQGRLKSSTYTVNQRPGIQYKPEVTASGSNSIRQGLNYALSLKMEDRNSDLRTIEINWDDGNDLSQSVQSRSNHTKIYNHTYLRSGTFTISATIFDHSGRSNKITKTLTVTSNALENQAPKMTIKSIVSLNGDVKVEYEISDPEKGYMGVDIYLTTKSGTSLGIPKLNNGDKKNGIYSVIFRKNTLSKLTTSTQYKIIADVFDNKSLKHRASQNFNYLKHSTKPTFTINTSVNSNDNLKLKDFTISITAKSDENELHRVAWVVYGLTKSTVLSSGYKNLDGKNDTESLNISINNLALGSYKIKIQVSDKKSQLSDPKLYRFQKIDASEIFISSVYPEVATKDVPTIFTITGQNIPNNLTIKLDDAICDKPYDVTSKSIFIKCTPKVNGSDKSFHFFSNGKEFVDTNNMTFVFKIFVSEDDQLSARQFKYEFMQYNPMIKNILDDKNINTKVSRAEAVIMVEKFLSYKSNKFSIYDMSEYYMSFADVDTQANYYNSLLKLSYYIGDNDTITPISKENKLFRPLDKVSRQEFIAIVVQGFDLDIIDDKTHLGDFKDLSDVAPWAFKYFNTAIKNKLMNGNRINKLNPLLEPTKALSVYEAMVILKNVKVQFSSKYKHTEAKFQTAESLDISKLLFKHIGYEYEPRYFESDATAIDIKSVAQSIANKEYCGNDNSILLSVNSTLGNSSNISEYYWWSTNEGYFRQFKGNTNFKKVCFIPATTKPTNGYKIVVNGGDNIGFVDSYTYTSLIVNNNKYDSANDKIATTRNPTFNSSKYMTSNKAYSVNVIGGFEKNGINVGIENITITLIDASKKTELFKGQAINGKVTFIVPQIPELYGENIKIQIVAHTQNAISTAIISNIKYLPRFILRGKVYNADSTNKAEYIKIGNDKVYLNENSEFYKIIDKTKEIKNLYIKVNSNSDKNSFDTFNIDLTYANPDRYLIMVGENKTFNESTDDENKDTDGDGISDKNEGTKDTDGDGKADYLDTDSDNDGISDKNDEGTKDTDGDGIADYLDTDSDNDGLSDKDETTNGTNPLVSNLYQLDIKEGTSLISGNIDMVKHLNNNINIVWSTNAVNQSWMGYSPNINLNKQIKKESWKILNEVYEHEGLFINSKISTTIKAYDIKQIQKRNSTIIDTHLKGYGLHGTNDTIDASSITCKNNLILGAVLKLEGNIWSIFMPNQTVPNMENFTYIYPNEGYMVWCYDENEY